MPRQCTLPPIKTVDSIGVYDLEGTTFTEALVDLYFDPGNNLTNTIINLNPGTNKTLSVTKSDTSPVIDIYRQTAPTNPGNDPEGKTQINGKLNLRINASETDTNDTQVIELIVGNHTLSFSDDVVVSSEVTSTTPHRNFVDGILSIVGQIEFENNLTIDGIRSTANEASDNLLSGVHAANYGNPDESYPAAPGHVVINGQATIKNIVAAGKTSSASGLIAENDGTITLKEKAEITNISARGTDYSYAAGIEANGGSITLERGVVISNVSAEDAFAIDAYNNGKVIINKSESQNQVHIDQDLAVATRSTITANFMSADSVFNGRTLWKPADAGEDPLSSRINLKFSNKATWNVPGNNTLFGTLMLDGGIVNLQPCIPLDNPQAVNLNVYELKGPGGTVGIRVDSERNITDRLHVGKGAGDHLVKILPTGTEATQESLDWLIKQDEGNARFTLVDEKVDFGLYQYELASKTNEDDLQSTSWYLTPSSNDDPDDSPPGPEYSQSGKTVLALASLGAQTTQHLNSLSDLRNRLGEVRHDTDAGLWVKVSGQKDRFTGFEGFGFTQKSWRVSLGADFMVDKWLIGANFKYADSSQKVKTDIRTKGDSHSEGMNLYATYLAENGAYADFVLSADRNCQKLSTAMSDGTPVSGKYDNIGYGASLEVGTQWTVSEMHNLFVEPQAQLAYYKARGKDFTLTNDMKVFQGDFESLTGRVGAVVGKNFLDMNGRMRGQAALDFGWKGELTGKNKLCINETEFSDRLVKHRFYYGANYNVNLTDNLRCYGYVEREQGHGYTKEIEAGVGLKYTF